MEQKSFIYWLQGFLELQEPLTISEKQVKTISNHLDLVFKYESKVDMPIIFTIYGLISKNQTEINEENTKFLKTILAQCFKHEIDPTYIKPDLDANTLQDIHDNGSLEHNQSWSLGRNENGIVYRC